jgi:hypothetical protein
MIDNALLERIRNLEPADRLELIGVVWDSLSATDLTGRASRRYGIKSKGSELMGRREETS